MCWKIARAAVAARVTKPPSAALRLATISRHTNRIDRLNRCPNARRNHPVHRSPAWRDYKYTLHGPGPLTATVRRNSGAEMEPEPTLTYRFQFTIARALGATTVLAVGLSILPTAYDNWIMPSVLDGGTNYLAFGLFAGIVLGGSLGTLIAGRLGFVAGFFVGALAGPMTDSYMSGLGPTKLLLVELFVVLWVAPALWTAWIILKEFRNVERWSAPKVSINLLLQLCTVAAITFLIQLGGETMFSIFCCVALTIFVLSNQ